MHRVRQASSATSNFNLLGKVARKRAAAKIDTPHLLPVTLRDVCVEAQGEQPDAMKTTGEYTNALAVPDGTATTVLELTETLKQILKLQDLKYKLITYKNSVTGDNFLKALQAKYGISEQEAFNYGKAWHANGIIHHVCYDTDFENIKKKYFRLQCHQTPEILNSYRIWDTPAKPMTAFDVHKLMIALESYFGVTYRTTVPLDGTPDNSNEYYRKKREERSFIMFEEAICELQKVDISSLDNRSLLAFGINVYNLMLRFALLKVGLPSSESYASFSTRVKFYVGKVVYSLDEWLNGILRGNKMSPVSMKVPFSQKDTRRNLVPHFQTTGLLHFGLLTLRDVCRPSFSGSIKLLSAKTVYEELLTAAKVFFEDERNLAVSSKKNNVRIARMFQHYRCDFPDRDDEFLRSLCDRLQDQRRQRLEKMLLKNKSIKISYFDDVAASDDNTTSDCFPVFDKSVLVGDEKPRLYRAISGGNL